MTRFHSFLFAALLVAACALTYANALPGAFTYDDKAIVRDNPRIRSPEAVGQIFTTSYFGGPPGTGSNYRPLLLLSFAAQFWIHGGDAGLFHAGNVLLHAAVTFLLWRLLLSVGLPAPASGAAALLFSVHPVHVEAVASLVGRGEVQAALFVLLYLAAALRVGRRQRPALALFLASVCYAAGLLTKESAAAAPALAFLLLLAQAEGGLALRIRHALARGWPLYAASGAVLLGVFALRARVLGGALQNPEATIFEVENPLSPLSGMARVGNAAVILARYVGRILFPLGLSADESARSLPILALRSPVVVAAVLLIVGAAFASLWSLPRARATAVGFLFFCAAFLPAANILFPIGTVFAERLAYLPSAGLCVVLGAWLAGSAADFESLSSPRLTAVLAVALLFSGRAAIRNTVWRSDEALFANSVRTAPRSAKAWYNDGFSAVERKSPGHALESEFKAIAIYADYWDAFAVKGHAEKDLGLLAEAEASYTRSVQIYEGYENGWFGLAGVREARGNLPGAEEALETGLRQKPDSLPLVFQLARVRALLERDTAGEDWLRAVSISPDSVAARLQFAAWLAEHDRAEEARRQWREALRREPANLEALRGLADSSARAGWALSERLARARISRLSRAS